MSRRAVVTLLLGTLLVLAPAARATPGDRFNATIAPTAVQPLSGHAYTVVIANLVSSSHSADNAHVLVPALFLVDPASLSGATTAAGTCTAATWSVSFDLLASTINAVAPDDAGSTLCPGGHLTISFNAGAPLAEDDYVWATTLYDGSSQFNLQGSQPSVTVDGTPPPAPNITSEPANPSGSSSASFSFSDGDSSATFACSLGGGAFAACSSPVTYNGLGEGTHQFAVKAIDPAGNESAATSYTWTIDLTPPPQPAITSAPPALTGSTSASFSFTDDEETATFLCRLDAAAFAACSSPVSYSGLGEGEHTFRVRAVDPAGNQSAVTSDTWTIDLTPPPIPSIDEAPPNVTFSTSATFEFSDAEAGAAFRCRIDGAAFSPCTSPKTYTGLSEGAHTFDVRAMDGVGNASASASFSWTIDLTNPVVTIDPASEPPDPTNHTSASFVFTSNHPGSTFECRLDGQALSACSSPKTYTGLPDGLHSFGVRARDSGGHLGLATIYQWTVDTVPPATSITAGPPTTTNSPSATFVFTSSEVQATFACSLDGGAFATCASPKTYAGLADGVHVFQVRASDRAGNADATPASYSWRVLTAVPPDTTPPGEVLSLKRSVAWRTLRLSWTLPADADFDHVEVLRTRSAKGAARAVVYEGDAVRYADRRFQNGTYYRYEIVSYDHAGNASPALAVVIRPSALLRAPRDGAIVHGPPRLLWTRVRRATYYNLQLYRGSQKVLSAWPAKSKLRLQRSWVYQGRRFSLRKGVYHWWVWPAFGPRARANYGRLLGTGTFRVR